MKSKCRICFEKDARVVKAPRWQDGMIADFSEGTCGDEACLKEYQLGMEEGWRLAEEEFEFRKMMEEISNGDQDSI